MKPTPKYANRPTSDDPRDVEAWALAEAARRLIDASREPVNTEAFQAALKLNQRLWTIFQAAMTEDDCGHPREVRTNIAALSLLVDRETMARLADLNPAKLDVLININRQVASGLTTRPGQAQPGAQPAPQPAQQAFIPPAPAAAPEAPVMPRESLRISI